MAKRRRTTGPLDDESEIARSWVVKMLDAAITLVQAGLAPGFACTLLIYREDADAPGTTALVSTATEGRTLTALRDVVEAREAERDAAAAMH